MLKPEDGRQKRPGLERTFGERYGVLIMHAMAVGSA